MFALSLSRPRPFLLARTPTGLLSAAPSPLAHRAYTRPAPRLATKPASTPASSARQVHASAPRATVHATDIAARRHAEIGAVLSPDLKVDLRQILNDLRDLETLDKLNGNAGKSGTGYRDGARALYPLLGKHAQSPSSTPVMVKFGLLHSTLSPSYTLAWGAISDRLRNSQPPARLRALAAEELVCLNLMRAHGVGAQYARKFYRAGVRSFDDLLAGHEGEYKLTKAQLIGVRLLEEGEMLIPRAEMEKLEAEVMAAVAKADAKFEGEILGSYRRGVPLSSDIDLAVRHPAFKNGDEGDDVTKPILARLTNQLKASKLCSVDNQLTNGAKKWSGWIKLPGRGHTLRRIDVRLVPSSSYEYIKLGSSGDAMLMKLLRWKAKQMGMCLNEYGMGEKYAKEDANPNGFKPATLRLVESEAEIFKLLGLPPLKPTERDQVVWEPIFRKAGQDTSFLHKL